MAYNPYKRPGFSMACFNITPAKVREKLEQIKRNQIVEENSLSVKNELGTLREQYKLEMEQYGQQLNKALQIVEKQQCAIDVLKKEDRVRNRSNEERKVFNKSFFGRQVEDRSGREQQPSQSFARDDNSSCRGGDKRNSHPLQKRRAEESDDDDDDDEDEMPQGRGHASTDKYTTNAKHCQMAGKKISFASASKLKTDINKRNSYADDCVDGGHVVREIGNRHKFDDECKYSDGDDDDDDDNDNDDEEGSSNESCGYGDDESEHDDEEEGETYEEDRVENVKRRKRQKTHPQYQKFRRSKKSADVHYY